MTNGERIAKFRAEKGMTQEELAEKLGYKSRSSINKMEIGKRDIPRNMIVKISEILEISPLELLGMEKSCPGSEEDWAALEKKLNMLSESDLKKAINYVDKLIADREKQQG